ncbi:MAG TPA: tetratricopeptide repeat protein [Bryobacterales bacterium]|jgi:tetratricopeptide (TPR) repeat protein|nr:tetratricopeptide repeat protein [Bryobacterales bacterium]
MLASVIFSLALLAQLVDHTAPAPHPAADLSPEKRGDVYMARKMYREAVDAYQEALKAQPKSYVLYNKLGIAYHQQLQLAQAQRCYERAIKLDNKYSEAINNLGTIYYAQKRYRRAISSYKKALSLNPDSASIHSNLGTAYFARKRYKEASIEYAEALRLDPEIFEHRGTFGSLLQERSVQDRARFHYYMAKTYAAAGYTDRAIAYLRRALEEGYKDKDKIPEEKEFAGLRDNPEFQQLMAADVPVVR